MSTIPQHPTTGYIPSRLLEDIEILGHENALLLDRIANPERCPTCTALAALRTENEVLRETIRRNLPEIADIFFSALVTRPDPAPSASPEVRATPPTKHLNSGARLWDDHAQNAAGTSCMPTGPNYEIGPNGMGLDDAGNGE